MNSPADPRRRAADRDVALRRLRRSTQASIAATVVAGGVFTALAAGSTHAKKIVRLPARRVTHAASVSALTEAPVPPLVGVDGGAPATPASAPAPPASAPAVTSQPAVVVSGGS